MHVIRTFVPESYENYNHLVFCPVTRQAAAVDPFDADHLLALANQHQLQITHIWITHEHGDHIRQLKELKQATGAKVFAPHTCLGKLSADVWLQDKDVILLGQSQIVHWLTPGHTPGHGVYAYLNADEPDSDFIICGDTLFNAGVGNTRSGNSAELYRTINMLSARITPSSRIYSGHDYIVTNLKFTLHHLPEIAAAHDKLAQVQDQSPEDRDVQTFAEELKHNLFLQLDSEAVMKMCGNDETGEEARLARFIHLRQTRDQW